jgi:hypothetical protein
MTNSTETNPILTPELLQSLLTKAKNAAHDGRLVGGVGGKLVSVGKDIFSEGSEKIAEGGLLHSGLGHFGQGVGALTRGTGGTVNAAGFATTNALANSGCGCG